MILTQSDLKQQNPRDTAPLNPLFSPEQKKNSQNCSDSCSKVAPKSLIYCNVSRVVLSFSTSYSKLAQKVASLPCRCYFITNEHKFPGFSFVKKKKLIITLDTRKY